MTSTDTVTSVQAPPAVGTDTPRGDGSRTARYPSEAVSAAMDVLLADAARDRRVPFVTPGPAVSAQIPTWRVAFANPSAAQAAEASWRVSTTSIPSALQPS